jgi:hypothetical protein
VTQRVEAIGMTAASSTILVFDPEGEIDQPDRVTLAKVPRREGLTIGVLDNGKPNAGLLLGTIAEAVAARFPGSRVVAVSKFGDGDGAAAMHPVLPEKLAWLIKECDVALTGSGD